MNTHHLIKIAALYGALAVAIGAFGAHALSPHLTELQIQNYKTASMYHFIHAVVLLILGFYYLTHPHKAIKVSFGLIAIGILFFSGSLYLLSVKNLIGGVIWDFLGPVTPIGGLLMMAGWLNLVRIKH